MRISAYCSPTVTASESGEGVTQARLKLAYPISFISRSLRQCISNTQNITLLVTAMLRHHPPSAFIVIHSLTL